MKQLALVLLFATLAGCAETPEPTGPCGYLWEKGDDEAILVHLVDFGGEPVTDYRFRMVGPVTSEAESDNLGCAAFHVPRGSYRADDLGRITGTGCWETVESPEVELQIHFVEVQAEAGVICE